MTAADSQGCGPLGYLVRSFYDAWRTAGCAGEGQPPCSAWLEFPRRAIVRSLGAKRGER